MADTYQNVDSPEGGGSDPGVDPDPPPSPSLPPTPPPPVMEPVAVTVVTPIEQPRGPLLPPEGPPPKGCFARRSGIEKCLIVLMVVIIIICLAFVGLFIVYYLFSRPPVGTCLTDNCVAAASGVQEKMNAEMSPCNDFYEYACGSWVRGQVLEPGEHERNYLTAINDKKKKDLMALLAEDPEEFEIEYKVKPKAFYKACMDNVQLERRAVAQFEEVMNEVGSFPTLDASWNISDFDMDATLIELAKLKMMPLFTIDVMRNMKDPRKYDLILSDATLTFESAKSYSRNGNPEDGESTDLKVLEDWLVEAMQLLGANMSVARKDMEDVVTLEADIAQLKRSDLDKADNPMINKHESLTTVEDLEVTYPWIDFKRFFRAFSDDAIHPEHKVVVAEADYLIKLGDLLQKTPARIINNYLMSQLLHLTHTLGPQFRDISVDLNKVLSTPEVPQWQQCVDQTTQIFSDSVSRMYIEKNFNKDAKAKMDTMTEDLKQTFKQMLEDNNWLSKGTKTEAKLKLDLMKFKIGYPDYVLDDEVLRTKYAHISADANMYLETRRDSRLAETKTQVKLLDGTPQDANEWRGSNHAASTDAKYDQLANEIVFPAAYLQDPVYNPGHTDSMIYGSIGAIIGNEIMHGFDEVGRKYNPKGENKKWWSRKDVSSFKSQSQCFIDQYGCYKWDGLSMDGEQSLMENIADNGGLKSAYKAYRSHIFRQGVEEPLLPGLASMHHDQIFFLSYSQVYCSKVSDEMKREMVSEHTSSPPPFRVNGALQNSIPFAKAFNCPIGSRMNPMRKCILW